MTLCTPSPACLTGTSKPTSFKKTHNLLLLPDFPSQELESCLAPHSAKELLVLPGLSTSRMAPSCRVAAVLPGGNRLTDLSIYTPPLHLKINIYLFSWLHQLLVLACGFFSLGVQTLSCSIWNLVPWPEMEPRPPALGVHRLRTTREVPTPLL